MVWLRSTCFLLSAVLTSRAETSPYAAIAAINPPKPAAASRLLEGTLEGQDEDGDDDDDDKSGADLKTDGQPKQSEPTLTGYIPRADPGRQKEEKKE